RHLAERRFDGFQRLARTTARTVDKPGGKALRVVQQNLEQMFGGELLVPFAQGERLRRLDEAARALSVLLEIHIASLAYPHRPEGPARISEFTAEIGITR